MTAELYTLQGVASRLATGLDSKQVETHNEPHGGGTAGGSATPWTPRRLALLQWLQEHAVPLAELYQGAVILADQRTAGWTRFVGHAVREIINRLPDVVGEEGVGGRLDYPSRVDAFSGQWKQHKLPTDGTLSGLDVLLGQVPAPGELAGKTVVPADVFIAMAVLVRDHENTRKRPLENAMRMRRALMPEGTDQATRPSLEQWVEVGNKAVGLTHNQRKKDDELAHMASQVFTLFEDTLLGLVSDYFETVKAIDALLDQANS